MTKLNHLVFLLILSILLPIEGMAQVKATMLEDDLNTDLIDVDNNNRKFFNISTVIAVENATEHLLRLELHLTDANGLPIDDTQDKILITTQSNYIDSPVDTITSWLGFYYDALALKPGPQKIYAQLKLFDETKGSYVQSFEAKKHLVKFTSEQPAPGIEVTKQYLEHNVMYNGYKSMKLNYSYSANWYKGKQIKVVAQLYKSNGTPIYTMTGKLDKIEATGNSTYTFSFWNDRTMYFYYSSMKLPKGRTACYLKLSFYDAKTGKLLPTKGNNKLEFYVTK